MQRFLNTRWLRRRRPRKNQFEPLEGRVLLSSVVVTSRGDVTADDAVTTLREALAAAEALPGPDQITFDPAMLAAAGPDARVELGSGELMVDSDVTIQGPARDRLTIDGNLISRVFHVGEGVSATISGLTITGGQADKGGGILNLGVLSLADAALTGNSASFGGGMYSSSGGGTATASLTVTNSTLTGNSASYGGGIASYAESAGDSASITVTDSTLSGNAATQSGGGIYISFYTDARSSATVTNSDLSGNSAAVGGGIDNSGDVTVTNSNLSGNSSSLGPGGGISNRGNLTIAKATVTGNSAPEWGGGGIYNSGNLTVTNSTLSGNSSRYASFGGGAILNAGSLSVTASVLTGNSANGAGGISNIADTVTTVTITNSTVSCNSGYGIYNVGSLAVANSTVSGNSGTGIFSLGTSTAITLLHNSIVAGNTSASQGIDLFGFFDDASSHNLIGVLEVGTSGITAGVNSNLAGTPAAPLDPLFVRNPGPGPDGVWNTPATLSTDDDYGDLHLLRQSPAVNAGGNDLVPAWLTTDLDGNPRVSGAAVDIGAFESDLVAPAVTSWGLAWDAAPPALVYTFTEDVGASLAVADLHLTNLSTSTDVPAGHVHLAYDAPTKTARFTFPGFPNGILPDGNYRATLFAAGVTDPAGNPMPADHVYDSFALGGDANRDRVVNFTDLLTLAKNYNKTGKTFSEGDFNYDGAVNFSDLLTLAKNYNKTLPVAGLAGLAPAAPATPMPALAAVLAQARGGGAVTVTPATQPAVTRPAPSPPIAAPGRKTVSVPGPTPVQEPREAASKPERTAPTARPALVPPPPPTPAVFGTRKVADALLA